MSRPLPPRPNLEHLGNQAKRLLRDMRQRNPGSKLADALHVVAQEYGFSTWPKLKAYVETLALDADPAPAAGRESPFTGTWTANLSKSTRHPANQFQSATLCFAVTGGAVTITDIVVDASGKEETGRNTIEADGKERPSGNGHVLATRWLGSRVLEVVTTKDSQPVGRVKYEVSIDGTSLTLLTSYTGVDGYGPPTHQTIVFDRA